MTEGKARALVAVLKAAYPRQDVPQPTFDLYAKTLEERDFHVGRVVVERIIRTSRFFPTVAELLAEFAALERTDLPDPELAWAEVCSELRRVGGYASPQWSCPEIGEAVKALGSWGTVARSSTPAADRARFVEAYRAVRNHALEVAQHGPQLARLSERVAHDLRQLAHEFGVKQLSEGDDAK